MREAWIRLLRYVGTAAARAAGMPCMAISLSRATSMELDTVIKARKGLPPCNRTGVAK
jgi:hypothetical protein